MKKERTLFQRSVSQLAIAWLVISVLTLILGIVMMLFYDYLYADTDEFLPYLLQNLIGALIMYGIPLVIYHHLLLFPKRERIERDRPPLTAKVIVRAVAVLIAVACIAYAATNAGTVFTGLFFAITGYPTKNLFIMPQTTAQFVVLAVYTVGLAPWLEETIFRGMIWRHIEPFGKGKAILITAFLFAASHGNLQQFFFAFSSGIALGCIRSRFGTILPSVFAHMLINTIGTLELVADITAISMIVLAIGFVSFVYGVLSMRITLVKLIGEGTSLYRLREMWQVPIVVVTAVFMFLNVTLSY
ncbi:MAG: CPBP family intramembrane metalloprotease [Oscillospiraceae bacterium]|jgi:membrane protease YdiL (CAAX protease family)|nr:CPBP family intramembrane metalloprotease [Oscillospiraceae bacterium]